MPSWATAILAIPHIHLIIIAILIMMFLVSVFGNIGIDWKAKKFTFGSQSKKRTCSDCIRILMAKRTTYDTLYNQKLSSILRLEMIFAEHKIVEMEQIISKEIHVSFKDEIRRSMKENGFAELSDEDFKTYLDERVETLSTKLSIIDVNVGSIIKDIYVNARNVTIRVNTELKKLEDEFCKEIDVFINEGGK